MRARVSVKAPFICSLGVSFILALIFMLIALPQWLDYLRPQLVVLVLLYWVLHVPQSAGIMMVLAWCLGIVLDVLFHTFLGMHALVLTSVVYMALKWQVRFNFFVLWQRTALIFLVTFLSLLPEMFLVLTAKPSILNALMCLTSSLVSALIWPYFTYFIDRLRRTLNLM